MDAYLTAAKRIALDERSPTAERVLAVRLLPSKRIDSAELKALLQPQSSNEVQIEAVRTHGSAFPEVLVELWKSMTPIVRSEAQEALLSRPELSRLLLNAVVAKKVSPNQLDAARRTQLLRSGDAELRRQAAAVLADAGSAGRKNVVEQYRSSLDLAGDSLKGEAVFKRICANCHRLNDQGLQVGPDLRAVLRGKSKEALLVDLLDPNREVDSRYVNYVVALADGRSVTGLLASESANSITLRRAGGVEDVIRRSEIERLQSTAQSLMPEGLEKDVDVQSMADLLEFLKSAPLEGAVRRK
jgi:putative heme-binding domain-containing protein